MLNFCCLYFYLAYLISCRTPLFHSDSKAGNRGRKKLIQRKDNDVAQQQLNQHENSQHRTNGFSGLNLSGFNNLSSDSFSDAWDDGSGKKSGGQGKNLPPSRKNGRSKPGESGLTPAVGGIHLTADLSPGFLNSPYPYSYTPNSKLRTTTQCVLE